MRLGRLIKTTIALFAFAALLSISLVFHWHSGAQSLLAIVCALLGGLLFAGVFIGWTWLFQVKAKSIVRKWAAEHGYTVLHFGSPFHTGAFSFWTTSRGQVIYAVTVRDGGLERKAWVRCGSYFGGVLFSDEIEVKWSDEPKTV
jgi:hypothetical protein